MKNLNSNTLKKGLFLLLCFFSLNSMALDDVIQIKDITAGDSYPDGNISPKHIIGFEGFTPEYPIDLKNTTYAMKDWRCWHSSGNNNTDTWLLLDLGKTIPVSDIYIWNLNQPNLGDRDIKDIKVTYSSDSSNGIDGTWNHLGNYTIPQSKGNGQASKAQLIVEMNQTVRFLKVQALSSYGSIYWGLGKIILLQNSFQGEQELLALKVEYKQAQAREFYKYTNESWQLFSTALKQAEKLLDEKSEDKEKVKKATEELKNKKAELKEKTNLISGAVVTASSFYGDGYEASKSIDNNFGTRWATKNGSDFWLEIDLGAKKTFNQVMIFETKQYGGRVTDLDVLVSDDGQTWNLWKKKGWSYNYLSAVSNPVNKRYIKLSFNDCSNEGINIDEIMLFNDPSAIETVDPSAHRPEEDGWIKQQPTTTPNVYQIRKAGLKYGMFLHYGINTFLGQEWTDGSYPASAYNPNLSTLDPDSWVKAAYNGGMSFIVLVAKHHEGFALWDTKVGTYNINNTGREGDKRDIVKEVSDACKKYGIKFALYYSAWDRNWDLHNTQESTGLDRVALNQSYNDFALAQITELMDGRYGEISEFWIDGAWVKKNKEWEFARMYNTVKTLQPTCQFGVNLTLEQLPDQTKGGEEMIFFPSDFRLRDPFFTLPGKDADPKIYNFEGNEYYLPFEATICINNSWFWTEKQNKSSVLSAANIKKSYDHMIDQENTLVLNLAPNTNGVFNDFDIEGLYAAARLMGIARGEARKDTQEGECKIEVRYSTQKGDVVFPTKEIYGKEGESYSTSPIELSKEGYKLSSTSNNASGKFTKEKIVVEYIYEDTGVSMGIENQTSENSMNRVFTRGSEVILECMKDSTVAIYNTLGIKIKELYLTSGENTSLNFNNEFGLYIVRFIEENGKIENMKIWIG